MGEINFYSKSGEYAWLSNFWPAKQVVGGVEYASNEHFYQAMKARTVPLQVWVRSAPSPYLAMCAGRALRDGKERRTDWKSVKFDVMMVGLRAKFTQNEDLMRLLVETGDMVLHEDSPTDMVCGKLGEDRLGKMLMQVRSELLGKLIAPGGGRTDIDGE